MQSPEQQRVIVQRMIDAGESEENIATVIQHFKTASGAPSDRRPSPTGGYGALSTLGDVVIGAGKGVANTAIGLSELVNKGASGLGLTERIRPEVFQAGRKAFATPEGTAQHIGYGAEQVGEFFVPVGGPVTQAFKNAPRLVKAGQALRAGAQTMMQTGGDVGTSAVSAGLTAVLPGSGALKNAAGKLERSAEKSIVQALGPTKEAMKATAKEIAPQMLQRGVSGSREAMLNVAKQETAKAGQAIGAAVTQAAQAGKTVVGQDVLTAIRQGASTLLTTDAAGNVKVIEGMQPVVRQLARLEDFVLNLGPDIPIDKAQALKTAWDKIVSRAGLYGQKAGAAATDQAKAWAFREAATAFRKAIVGADPSLEVLNQEFRFWKGLKDVLTETEKRTQAQTGGLINAGIQLGGGVAGFSYGGSLEDRIKNAALGAAGGKFITLLKSPYFKTTVAAPLKQRLADALASDSAVSLNAAVRSIMASLPAQLRQSLQEPE